MAETVITPISGSSSSPLPSSTTTAATTSIPASHWDGDTWVEQFVDSDGKVKEYRVARKWTEKYPSLFGPCAEDPDEGNGEAELDDPISRLLNKFTGAGGTFSTWTERHAFIIFASIGYNDVESSADVPPVPRFFLTETQYCFSGLAFGRAAKKLENSDSFKALLGNKKVVAVLAAAFTAGGAMLPSFVQAALKLFAGG
jgi:hypothetical protein